jgi:hypothetical protein
MMIDTSGFGEVVDEDINFCRFLYRAAFSEKEHPATADFIARIIAILLFL